MAGTGNKLSKHPQEGVWTINRAGYFLLLHLEHFLSTNTAAQGHKNWYWRYQVTLDDHNMVDRLSVQGQSYHQAPQQSLQICLVAQCWESIDSSKCQDHIRSQLRKEDCLSRMHPNSHFSPLRAEIVEQHLNQETETKMGDFRILPDENEWGNTIHLKEEGHRCLIFSKILL